MRKTSVSSVNSQISGLPYGPLSKVEVTHELGLFLEVMAKCARIQVRSATLRHLSSHAHFLEYYGW
ncbi:hypothetical protein, partial [Vibrio mediterranei]